VNIFVGNLPRDITEDALRAEFQKFGEITSVSIIKDKFSGESKGFGFVEMAKQAEAEAAMNGLNGKELGGKALTVNEARPRTEHKGKGGRRGGGFGGGRRFSS
jgi:RNA recognition motif-containing protein